MSKKPKGASERMRRLRDRQKRGAIVSPVENELEEIETLVLIGWLPEKDSEDRNAIGDAIKRMMAEMTAWRLANYPHWTSPIGAFFRDAFTDKPRE